jgi:hypothetical protein
MFTHPIKAIAGCIPALGDLMVYAIARIFNALSLMEILQEQFFRLFVACSLMMFEGQYKEVFKVGIAQLEIFCRDIWPGCWLNFDLESTKKSLERAGLFNS